MILFRFLVGIILSLFCLGVGAFFLNQSFENSGQDVFIVVLVAPVFCASGILSFWATTEPSGNGNDIGSKTNNRRLRYGKAFPNPEWRSADRMALEALTFAARGLQVTRPLYRIGRLFWGISSWTCSSKTFQVHWH